MGWAEFSDRTGRVWWQCGLSLGMMLVELGDDVGEFGDGTGQDWGRGRGVTRVRSYLHTLAELANLAMDHIALLLRYVGFLEHARRFGDRFLCGYK